MKKTGKNRFKLLVICTTLCFLFFIGMESFAFARAGGGRSSGSRGFSSGGSYQRSTPSQSGGTYQQRQQQAMPQRPPVQQPAPSFGRSLLYGIGGGLLGGMVGSMLFGGRASAGGAGGWGGGGGGGFGFGDIIILLIIVGIIYFVVKRYRARKQEMLMSTAGAGYASSPSYSYNEPAPEQTYEPAMQGDLISQGLRYIKDMDPSFDENMFKELVEDIFFKIQGAWTKRDMSVVRDLLAPQMLNTFQNDVNAYIANKQFNRLENIAVRQVEIVDAAQDQGEEYITVKFLASLLDYTTDETNNQVISGNSTDPVKFLEYWTFTRKIGNRNWVLAGITQERDY
ncbi:MAG: Tim44 domain-containing protein [Proteobacteria bacterium]|nr:Tim44 domain-containing protein [Pseudomonadota bacterium]